jgi:hypothetical protein
MLPAAWRFEQLWGNGRRATRARSPNEFYAYMAHPVARGIDPLTGKDADLSSRAIAGRGDDLAAVLGVPKDELADVTAVVYHSWERSRQRIAAADVASNTLVAAAGAPWPFFKWDKDQRYYLENFRAALDAPGEWFLARDGTLSHMPLPGEDLSQAQVIAPVCGQFVRFKGDATGSVEHITLKGLAFEYAGYLLPPNGQGDAQAAHSIEAVIVADAARNLTIEDCAIAHTGLYGGWGLYTDEGSTGITMENNLVYNTKTGGFHQHYGKDNLIRNNIFAFPSQHQLQRTRKEDHLSFTFSNNIVVWDAGKLLDGQWQDPNVRLSHNLYWRSAGKPIDFAGKCFADWQNSGHDEGPVIAGPQFVDAQARHFRLKRANAAVAAIGFKPFDFTRAGVYGEAAWKQLAAARRYPPLAIPPCRRHPEDEEAISRRE